MPSPFSAGMTNPRQWLRRSSRAASCSLGWKTTRRRTIRPWRGNQCSLPSLRAWTRWCQRQPPSVTDGPWVGFSARATTCQPVQAEVLEARSWRASSTAVSGQAVHAVVHVEVEAREVAASPRTRELRRGGAGSPARGLLGKEHAVRAHGAGDLAVPQHGGRGAHGLGVVVGVGPAVQEVGAVAVAEGVVSHQLDPGRTQQVRDRRAVSGPCAHAGCGPPRPRPLAGELPRAGARAPRPRPVGTILQRGYRDDLHLRGAGRALRAPDAERDAQPAAVRVPAGTGTVAGGTPPIRGPRWSAPPRRHPSTVPSEPWAGFSPRSDPRVPSPTDERASEPQEVNARLRPNAHEQRSLHVVPSSVRSPSARAHGRNRTPIPEDLTASRPETPLGPRPGTSWRCVGVWFSAPALASRGTPRERPARPGGRAGRRSLGTRGAPRPVRIRASRTRSPRPGC